MASSVRRHPAKIYRKGNAREMTVHSHGPVLARPRNGPWVGDGARHGGRGRLACVWHSSPSPRFCFVGTDECEIRQRRLRNKRWFNRGTMGSMHIVGYDPRTRRCRGSMQGSEDDHCYAPVDLSESSRASTAQVNRPSRTWS